MGLLDFGAKKKKRSKKLKAPKKNATLKSKEKYIEKMSKRIATNERIKKADTMIDKIKNYSFGRQ